MVRKPEDPRRVRRTVVAVCLALGAVAGWLAARWFLARIAG